MASSLGRLRARTIMAMVMAGALFFSGPSAADAQEDAATDQRVVRLVGTYDVQPDRGRVDVVEEITVSNVRGSRRSGNTITSYFWTGHTIWIPADAENVSIQVEGTELEWEVAETISGIAIIDADYRRNLNFGQTRVIDITYSLPTYGPGSGDRRINGAFFFLDMVTCCGFEEVELTVTVPIEFDVVPPSTLRFDAAVVGGQQQFTFADNEVTGQFTELIFTDWAGFNDAGMERTTATVGDSSVELIYPPDDQAWGTETAADITEIGTALEDLIGQPVPLEGLVVRQGPSDDFDRWGLRGPFDEPVTIPRDYDRLGLATTIAHAWLADGPFADETIGDGLAFEFASKAIARTGGAATEPSPPTGSGPLGNEGTHWVMRQISDEIGIDGLQEIVQLARDSESAYVGPGEPERVATVPDDWRRFLDLAEQRLGSQQVSPLFEQHVLDEQGTADFEQRAAAVADYQELDAATQGVVPLGIRTAMTSWDFDRAGVLLTAAREAVAERDRVIGESADREADPGLALGQDWADATTVEDLDAVRSSILDRESDLNRGGMIRLAVLSLGVLALVGVIIAGGLRRRVSAKTPLQAQTPEAVAAAENPPAEQVNGPGSWPPPPEGAPPEFSDATSRVPAPVAEPTMAPTAAPPPPSPVSDDDR